MAKQKEWKGYFAPYFAKASRRGVNALDVLDEEWADGLRTADNVLPHVSSNSDVLLNPCGIGRVSRFVAPHCRSLHCTDISKDALREARWNLREFANVSLQRTNGYDLRDFPDGAFDCVYPFTAFFHLDFELVVHYFGEIERVLRPGGVGIIEFKKWTEHRDVAQFVEKIERGGGIERYEKQLDKWRYVSKEMLELLCKYHGFAIVDDDVTKFTCRKADRAPAAADHREHPAARLSGTLDNAMARCERVREPRPQCSVDRAAVSLRVDQLLRWFSPQDVTLESRPSCALSMGQHASPADPRRVWRTSATRSSSSVPPTRSAASSETGSSG